MYPRVNYLKEQLDSLISYKGGVEDSFFDGQVVCLHQITNLALDEDIIFASKMELLQKNKDLKENTELFNNNLDEIILFNVLKIVNKRIKSNKDLLPYPTNYYKKCSINKTINDPEILKQSYLAGKQYFLEKVRGITLDILKSNSSSF